MKTVLYTLLATITLVGTNAVNYYFTKEVAYKQGLQDYHGACHFIPGPRLDNDTGTVVYCYGLGQVSPEQLEKERRGSEKNRL
jgi:hypothetical protein